MNNKRYITTARFYYPTGKFIVADSTAWILRSNAKFDAREWLEEAPELLPTNISVRGHDGRFIKWKN